MTRWISDSVDEMGLCPSCDIHMVCTGLCNACIPSAMRGRPLCGYSFHMGVGAQIIDRWAAESPSTRIRVR